MYDMTGMLMLMLMVYYCDTWWYLPRISWNRARFNSARPWGSPSEKKMLEKCWVIGGLGWSVWFLYPNYAGWWLSLPLWKIWVRQSGWWHSHKFMESHKNHVPNHQPVYIMDQKLNKTKSSTGYTHDIPMSYLRWRVGGSLFGSTWVKIDDLCSIKTGCKTHFKAVPFW